LISIGVDSGQIVLRYPQPQETRETNDLGNNRIKMRELGSGIRTGKNSYWMRIGKEDEWQKKLLLVLRNLQKDEIIINDWMP
jgi:hypothetical protein